MRMIRPLGAPSLILAAVLAIGACDSTAAALSQAAKEAANASDSPVELPPTLRPKDEHERAFERLESAIQLDPDLVMADQLLVVDLLREKQYDKAMAAVEGLERKRPNDAATFNLKGAVFLGKGDAASARKSFERAMAMESGSITAAANLAQLDLMEKKPEAARQRFEAVLAKEKNNVQAMLGLAMVAAATGQNAEYVAWLEKASRAAPRMARPRLLLGSYYLRTRDVRRAMTMAQEVLTAEPENTQALDLLGTAQLAGGEAQNAANTYSKVARILPGDPGVLYMLATAQAAAKNTGQARDALNKALELKPDYQYAELLLGTIELEAGDYAAALKIAQKVQKQFPRSHSGFALQGNIQMAQKQYAGALKAYEKAFELNKNGLLAISVHQALRAGGNVKEADARLLRWLSDHPNDTAAREYLATTYMEEGRNPQAIEQYQLLLQTDARNPRALNNLAWLYQQQRDPRALATAEQGYQLDPDNPSMMDTLGWILLERGQVDRSVGLLQKAAAQAPGSAEIHYHLAVALAKSGDTVRARQELQDLLGNYKSFPRRPEAQALLEQLAAGSR